MRLSPKNLEIAPASCQKYLCIYKKKKDTRFSRRRSIAASSSQGRFVAAKTNTRSSVRVKPSICNLIELINLQNQRWHLQKEQRFQNAGLGLVQ